MNKREAPFLLCEAICEAVRQRLPQALDAQCTFFFDYQGLTPVTTANASTVHTIVDRLLKYSLQASRDGVFFRATVQHADVAQCRVRLRLASVTEATDPADDAVLSAPPAEAAADPDLTLVWRLCTVLGGELKVLNDPNGLLAECAFLVPILEPALAQEQVQAEGASVWLVSSPPFVMKMLAARMRRLGWRTRLFSSVSEVEEGLRSSAAAPALLIASAHRGITAAEANRLRAELPVESCMVLQVLQHMTLGEEVQSTVEVHAVPLSPRRLMHYTELARLSGQQASGNTQAGVLEVSGPGTVLVVDDNEVNRILCEEMVRLLGYRVVTVESGEAAVEACLEEAPSAVLMDLHMPGMGGLAAATHLRALQSTGRLAPFRIWLVSADRASADLTGTEDLFDGAIPKPIRFPALRAALASAGK